jgi:citrate lyase subunit beta/citryl-CoA lyase
MIAKSRTLPVDQVFLDLEDAVAPIAKDEARQRVVAALMDGPWLAPTIVVRINDVSTQWAYQDVVALVEGAGAKIDCIMLPKAESAAHILWLDLLLTQIELARGLEPGRIGIEAQIESALGLVNVDEIAAASSRVQTLIFGPADFMADINMRSLVVGGQPEGYGADAYHYILMRILMAGRAYGKQVIDGPFGRIKDLDGYRVTARRSAALGYDGKWVLHPGQIDVANEIYSPGQAEYDRAEYILEAYEHYTSPAGGGLGAVMLGEEMIDEASRKMALPIALKGRAAGLRRQTFFDPERPTGIGVRP